MAAFAAKYAHCDVRYPVEYRSKVPFRPELVAPLDLGPRTLEIYQHDRELDRALVGVSEYVTLLRENADWGLGPGELFVAREGARIDIATPTEGQTGVAERTDDRRAFTLNLLHFLANGARFRPPWNPSLVQEAHALLMRGLETAEPPGEFRKSPFAATGRLGMTVYRACPPDRIAPELAALMDWVDRYGPTLMPAVPAAVLLHGFQSLRPFSTGNLAVGWVLAQYYLQMFGLPNIARTPFAELTAREPELRLKLLLWTEGSGSFTEFIDFTVDATLAAYRSSILRWLGPERTKEELGETALRLLARARRSSGWFSAQEANRWVSGQTEQTVLRRLNELVALGYMESLGQTRAKRYRLVEGRGIVPQLVDRVLAEANRLSERPPRRARQAERLRNRTADR